MQYAFNFETIVRSTRIKTFVRNVKNVGLSSYKLVIAQGVSNSMNMSVMVKLDLPRVFSS